MVYVDAASVDLRRRVIASRFQCAPTHARVRVHTGGVISVVCVPGRQHRAELSIDALDAVT